MVETAGQRLLVYAADLLSELERDHPGAEIDDFVIVASYGGPEVSGVRISSNDERPWAIKGLLDEGKQVCDIGDVVGDEDE